MAMTAAVGGLYGWRLIGTRQASYQADHDTIRVQGPQDDFRKIKLKVSGADLNIKRPVVTYDNGEQDNIDVRENIRQSGEIRALDLRGSGKRSIRRIDFWYDTQGLLKGKATVRVYGSR
jgi:hypothetical protein